MAVTTPFQSDMLAQASRAPTPAPGAISARDDVLYYLIEWAVPVLTVIIAIAVFVVIKRLLLARWREHAKKTIARWDDLVVGVLDSLRVGLLAPMLIYAVSRPLGFPLWVDRGIHIVAIVCMGIQSLITLRVVVDAALDELLRRSQKGAAEYNSGLSSSLTVIRVLIMSVAVALVALAALDNMGVSVTPMLTGLGIGGVAVALAVQSILSDLFGSLSIILDKPFVVGDSIVVGQQSGTVEQIGIKTTRVRANSGEQLVFSNSDLLKSRIQNYKRMRERRAAFAFSVPHETPVEKLREIVPLVKKQFEGQSKARLDRCHMTTPSDYALTFECVYVMLTPEYNEYADFQQSLIFALVEGFHSMGIRFAVRQPPPAKAEPPPQP